MTFALGLFATLISAMFVATFASSIVAAAREAREADEQGKLTVF